MEDVYMKVSADNQLQDSEYVKFFGDGKTLKVTFLGNSITRHGRKDDIGWFWDFGMAASCKEKDYVHLLATYIDQYKPATYCISQIAAWEFVYKTGNTTLASFEAARNFSADILIVKLGANCPKTDFDKEAFVREFELLLNYHNPEGKAKIYIAGDFYHHVVNDVIEQYALKKGYPFIKLEDLSDDPNMRAYGLFEHGGVAGHPGDAGMKAIADRIWEMMKSTIVS